MAMVATWKWRVVTQSRALVSPPVFISFSLCFLFLSLLFFCPRHCVEGTSNLYAASSTLRNRRNRAHANPRKSPLTHQHFNPNVLIETYPFCCPLLVCFQLLSLCTTFERSPGKWEPDSLHGYYQNDVRIRTHFHRR